MQRLDKYLADAGTGSRSEVKNIIRKGRVTVGGRKETMPDAKVGTGQQVCVDGRPVTKAPEHVYYLMNKPAGVITATEDRAERTVLDILPDDLPYITPARRKKLFPVGRLDKDTEGLLLITDDGALAHRLLSPKHHVEKEYYARIEGKLCQDAERRFELGMDIGDGDKTLPAKLIRISDSEIRVILVEGRFHQVKRMVSACGAEVVYLKRVRMGDLTLPQSLSAGMCGYYSRP
ncbi:MAG: rRNA pseudouridine synthase [Blautia sp.]|nr:rRNA pseudouridine synthase [Blautia sp.]